MRNDGQKQRANGFIPSSFRALSSYFGIVSSGASSVASTVRSAASSIVDRDEDARYDQVLIQADIGFKMGFLGGFFLCWNRVGLVSVLNSMKTHSIDCVYQFS